MTFFNESTRYVGQNSSSSKACSSATWVTQQAQYARDTQSNHPKPLSGSRQEAACASKTTCFALISLFSHKMQTFLLQYTILLGCAPGGKGKCPGSRLCPQMFRASQTRNFCRQVLALGDIKSMDRLSILASSHHGLFAWCTRVHEADTLPFARLRSKKACLHLRLTFIICSQSIH